MDRKSVIIVVLSILLLVVLFPLADRLFPPVPAPPPSTNDVVTAEDPWPRRETRPARDTDPVEAVEPPAKTQAEELVVLESEQGSYTFTSHGGGLKTVELNRYPAAINCRQKTPESQRRISLNTGAPAPILSMLNGAALQGDGVFQLRQRGDTLRAEKNLPNGLRIIKEFQIGTNYLITATVRLENRTNAPIALPAQEWVAGTATPMSVRDESMTLGLFWYNGEKAEDITAGWFSDRTLGCIPKTPQTEYRAGIDNVHWTAVHNQFFTVATIPNEPAPGVSTRKVNLPPPDREVLEADPKAIAHPSGLQTTLLYPATILTNQQSIERTFTIYAGPKEYKRLSELGIEMGNNQLDLVMDYGGFFGFFAKALLLSMNGLHSLGLSYGLSIIGITIIIKLLFWPLTNASTRSMKRMAALQPQMKALQEKYKEDPKKMNLKLMEFMKENKVSPLGGCLPLLLQMPVFFGFFKMIRSAVELRGAEFLWACDLSQSDTIFFIPVFNFPLNPMPLIMGATMLWQARMTPVSPGMDPTQQKIMKYMPLMFIVFLYNFSAGLTLYWTVQNLLTIAQMKLTKTQPVTAAPAKPAAPVRPAPIAKKRKKR